MIGHNYSFELKTGVKFALGWFISRAPCLAKSSAWWHFLQQHTRARLHVAQQHVETGSQKRQADDNFSKIPAAPESKLDKLNSKIQIQPAFIDSVPVVLDAKRAPLVAKRRSPAELNKLCDDFNKLISSDPRFATSKSSSSSTPSPIAPEPFIHPILDQDKAVFSVGVKRDGEQILSSRAAKRQRQAGNRKARATASDFFGVQDQS